MENNKSTLLRNIGVVTTFIAIIVRMNARQLAWPKKASWGAGIEGTPCYAKQLAIADVSNLFLAFGLILIAAVLIYSLFNNGNTAEQ